MKRYKGLVTIIIIISFLTNIFLLLQIGEKRCFSQQDNSYIRKIRLKTISDNLIMSVKENPNNIRIVFETCKDELKSELGQNFNSLDDQDLFVIVCCIVAYKAAPYGGSLALELNDILKQPKLDCHNYAFLLNELCYLNNVKDYSSNLQINIVGWDGGVVGNHSQVFSTNSKDSISLLLDPTIGIFAITNFNNVASGKVVPKKYIVDFSDRNELSDYRGKVINALTAGEYKPSDLLYYFENLNQAMKYFKIISKPGEFPPDWMTPGSINLKKEVKKQ